MAALSIIGDVRGDLDRILESVVAAGSGEGRCIVAVDGIGGSGKTIFAAAVADRVVDRQVIVLHTDDFFNAATVRHSRGRYSPEGFWLDTYNLGAMVSWALEPLRGGEGSYRSSSFDAGSGTTIKPAPKRVAEDAFVVVEGAFLHREELEAFWDFSVFLDVTFEEAARRMRERAGHGATSDQRLLDRYHGAQRIYFETVQPWQHARLVVDNTDPASPRIIAPLAAAAAMNL